jgi:hypothetical protein
MQPRRAPREGNITVNARLRVIAFATVAAVLSCTPLAWSATGYGNLSGVVLDPSGVPQMGASVWLTPEGAGKAAQLRSNQSGSFGTLRLRPGLYSVRVTLAGFLPAVTQHVRVKPDATTNVRVELQSIFTAFNELRRPSPEPNESDDWKWVLRSASATRPVLQWRDGDVIVVAAGTTLAEPNKHQPHVRVEMTTAGRRAGSVSNFPNAPTTAASYDQPLGAAGRLLVAGQMSYADSIGPSATMASIWIPSGEFGRGPETTVVLRQQPLRPGAPPVRQLRLEHSEQLVLSDRLVAEFGAEYLLASMRSMDFSLRPRGRVVMQLSPSWVAAFFVESEPGAYALRRRGSSLESALESLDTLPTRVWSDSGAAVIGGGWHEEFALQRDLASRGSFEIAVFHDFSKHRAAYGFDSSAACTSSLQACSSWAYAHDAGSGGGWGTRLMYQERVIENVELTAVYSFAEALTAGVSNAASSGRTVFLPAYRHSVAGSVSATMPLLSTKVGASYKWLSGPVVSRQDMFGEAALGIDPNLSFSVRQPLPSFLNAGRWEAMADFRNVLAQGYLTVDGRDTRTVYAPVLRSLRGGLSFQF